LQPDRLVIRKSDPTQLASEAIAWQSHWRGKKKSFGLLTKNHIDSP
jgi:hypothetical protein